MGILKTSEIPVSFTTDSLIRGLNSLKQIRIIM